MICIRNQSLSVSSTLRSEYIPSGIYSPGAHCCRLPPSSGDISNSISRRLTDPPPRLLSFTVVPTSVPVQWFTQLGLGSNPIVSFIPETITTTFLCLMSDKPVYATSSFRPVLLAPGLQQWQDLSFLTSGIPIRPFQADLMIYMDASTRGWAPI